MGKGFGKKFTESIKSPLKKKQNPFTWKHKYGRYKFSLSSSLEIWSITWTGWSGNVKRYFVHICIMSCSGHQQPQLILQMFIKQEKLKTMRCSVSSHKHLTLYPRRWWHLARVRCDRVTGCPHTADSQENLPPLHTNSWMLSAKCWWCLGCLTDLIPRC